MTPIPDDVLDARMLALLRLAVAIARGGPARLRKRFEAVLEAGVPPSWIEELLLQSFLNVGYPLTLAAWGVWREVAGPYQPPPGADEPLAHADWQRWLARGADVCAQVYGRAYRNLLRNLRALHPAVEAMVLVDAYGKIIGRPGLELKQRELCTLVAVATRDTPLQLRAHLHGALNVGWTQEEVDAAMAVVRED